jgi:hypothetical protein
MKPSKVSANARADLRAGRPPPSKAAWTVNAADRAGRRGFPGPRSATSRRVLQN